MRKRVGIAMIGLVTVGALAGCGSARSTASASTTSAAGSDCGTVRTAAGFPAVEHIVRGTVSCATVTKVFTAYYAALAAGQAPGNGGGGPVKVDGWTCSSPPAMATPVSTCDNGTSEITARVKVR